MEITLKINLNETETQFFKKEAEWLKKDFNEEYVKQRCLSLTKEVINHKNDLFDLVSNYKKAQSLHEKTDKTDEEREELQELVDKMTDSSHKEYEKSCSNVLNVFQKIGKLVHKHKKDKLDITLL